MAICFSIVGFFIMCIIYLCIKWKYLFISYSLHRKTNQHLQLDLLLPSRLHKLPWMIVYRKKAVMCSQLLISHLRKLLWQIWPSTPVLGLVGVKDAILGWEIFQKRVQVLVGLFQSIQERSFSRLWRKKNDASYCYCNILIFWLCVCL